MITKRCDSDISDGSTTDRAFRRPCSMDKFDRLVLRAAENKKIDIINRYGHEGYAKKEKKCKAQTERHDDPEAARKHYENTIRLLKSRGTIPRSSILSAKEARIRKPKPNSGGSDRINVLQKMLATAQLELDNEGQQVKTLEKEVDHLQMKIEELEEEKNDLETSIYELETSLREAKKDAKEEKKLVAKKNAKRESILLSAASNAKADLQDAQKRNETLIRKMSYLKKSVETLQQSNTQSISECEQHVQVNKEMAEKIKCLETNLESLLQRTDGHSPEMKNKKKKGDIDQPIDSSCWNRSKKTLQETSKNRSKKISKKSDREFAKILHTGTVEKISQDRKQKSSRPASSRRIIAKKSDKRDHSDKSETTHTTEHDSWHWSLKTDAPLNGAWKWNL